MATSNFKTIAEYFQQGQNEIDGWVVRWDDPRCFGLIRTLHHRKSFVVIGREIDADGIGRRYLIEGEEVRFTPKGDRATSVHPNRAPLIDVPADYEEECVVDAYDRATGIGFLRRPYGGSLIFNRSNITLHERLLQPGLYVLAKPVLPIPIGPSWKAVNVRIAPEISPATAMELAFEKVEFNEENTQQQ
jgi:hypothetical protein